MTLRTLFAGCAFVVAGCATVAPPPELLAARTAYSKASRGPAAKVVPDELHKARTALDTAEQAYGKEPKAQSTRDLAYIAQRKAELAAAKAQVALAKNDKAALDKEYTKTLEVKQKDTQSTLDSTRAQAATDQKAAADQLSAEKEKSAAAMRDLAKIAQLREEDRGTVISLSGDVLFVTNQSVLLPSAQLRLNQLADALNSTPKHLIIEGHTDSRGSDASNQDLSLRRATSVRDYLVTRSVTAERIQVRGLGETQPIGDNATAEGRAMNRRVEIVIEGKQTADR